MASEGSTDSGEWRIVLIGKTGAGKSSAGNTILNREAFDSEASPTSQTSECKKERGEIGGRKVAVVDTPGLYDTSLNHDEVLRRIKMCIGMSSPGPHAFLVVLQVGRFTEEEKQTVQMIQDHFGKDAAKYTMVLFTHGDKLKKKNKKKTIEQFISESEDLRDIIKKCNGRHHVFNNEVDDLSQTSQLLVKIETMMEDNGGSHYTTDMFLKAEEEIEREKERLLKESEAQRKKEMDDLKAKYEGEKLELQIKMLKEMHEAEARARAEKANVVHHHYTSHYHYHNDCFSSSALFQLRDMASEGSTDSGEWRIVLIGKTGAGKSSAGNTILNREAFDSEASPTSQTSECKKERGEIGGRKVAVVDTPGLYDTSLNHDEVLRRIKMCIGMSSPGPHAFLVVLQVGRFTEEEKQTVQMIQDRFGKDAAKYTMVLFTHGDKLKKKKTIEQFISESEDLQDIIKKCNGRHHVFNNEVDDLSQTSQLLVKIETMMKDNGGSHYTTDMFLKAEEETAKEKERLLKESEAQRKKEMDDLKAKYDGELLELQQKMRKQIHEAEARARAGERAIVQNHYTHVHHHHRDCAIS
ncbi:GTPase IMAP family member 8-like [Pempheris klunzingeri]|uniref:GTPase IMAP family member 8-like n=1 Tax=Pempheris klunzingeri TaxID=3127111 RepID=UPI003980FB9A